MRVDIKSAGILIDDLIVTNLKEWHIQEECKGDVSDEFKARAYERIQTLNVRRNLLINALDNLLSPDIASTTPKTYK